ncbi:MAG: hypothetical protein ABFQ53_01340 [Patescibacteria group bacterium]
MEKTDNFDWINDVSVKTEIAQKLIDHCHNIDPVWTQELDAAARITLYATNGGLASKEENERLLLRIENLLAQNVLCNDHMIEIAADILDDPYFQHSKNNLFDKNHCAIVKKAQGKIDVRKMSKILAAPYI